MLYYYELYKRCGSYKKNENHYDVVDFRDGECTFDITDRVHFLESRYGDCLHFVPPIPEDNIIVVQNCQDYFVQPFACDMPLPVMDLSCDNDCQTDDPDTTGIDPCIIINESVEVVFEQMNTELPCCFIKITVTNNLEKAISIVRNGFTLLTLEAGESSWIITAQGPESECPVDPALNEDIFISHAGIICEQIIVPDCEG